MCGRVEFSCLRRTRLSCSGRMLVCLAAWKAGRPVGLPVLVCVRSEVFLEVEGDFVGDFFACGDLNLFSSAWFNAYAGSGGSDHEGAEAGEADGFAFFEGFDDDFEGGVEDGGTVFLGDGGAAHHVDDLAFGDLVDFNGLRGSRGFGGLGRGFCGGFLGGFGHG